MANASQTFRGSVNAGVSVYYDATATGTPGIEQTLITFSVPAGKTHELKRLQVSSFRAGKFVVEAGGSIIGTIRSGAAEFNPVFEWDPGRSISAGTLVEVKYTQRADSGASDVEAFLMLIET